MALPQLPPPIDIDAATKKRIIDGLKTVIDVFQSKGLIRTGATYSDVIHDAQLLYDLVQAYHANRNAVENIVVDKDGAPVASEEAQLACGVTLNQVQALLVKTCARYVLEEDTREEEGTVTSTVTTRGFLGFKKTEKVEKKIGGGFDERKVKELMPFMAFHWQMRLLNSYTTLTIGQITELGENILALHSPEAIREVAQFDHNVLKKCNQIVGGDMPDLLAKKPQAIGGIVHWPRDMYSFYRSIVGNRLFEFYARDQAFYMRCADMSRPTLKLYGEILGYIAAPNLQELQRLDMDKVDVLLNGLRAAMGDKFEALLTHPRFARDVLRRLVEGLLHLDYNKDQLQTSTTLTCKAIAPEISTWLAKTPVTAA